MYVCLVEFSCALIMQYQYQWYFYAPEIEDQVHIVFVLSFILSFCNSVINSGLLSETLTLLITFEQWVLELWFFTWVFPVIRPFVGYHYFLPCDLDLGVWPINLPNNFWTVSAKALIFHISIPCDKIFLLVLNLLTLTFDLFFKLTLVITSK